MANPFKRPDAVSPGGSSDSSVPMPRFGVASPVTTDIAADALARFPPADRFGTGVEVLEDTANLQDKISEKVYVAKNPFGTIVEPRQDVGPSSASRSQVPSSPLSKQRASKLMDVESFKNLLMTGNAESTGSGTTLGSTRGSGTLDGESNSSREPSLNFGSSMHAPAQDRIAESAEYSSSDFSESEIDESQFTTQQKLLTRVKPPPPPKSKHGKVIQKGPQTVSFDDFAPTLETVDPQLDKTERKRASSASKPLPPTPPVPRFSAPLSQSPSILEPTPAEEASPPLELVAPPTTTKKTAPPPPLARRTTVTKRPRRDTANSMASVNEDQTIPKAHGASESQQSLKSPPPPPPPSRRMGSASSISFPQVATDAPASRALFEPASNRSRSNSQTSLVTPPPPPARRRSSRASIELNQTQRPASTIASGNASRRTSGEMVRSSIDSQRVLISSPPGHSILEESVEKEDRERPSLAKTSGAESGSSLSPVPALPLESSSSGDNVLADMEAFQREIDALRARYHEPQE